MRPLPAGLQPLPMFVPPSVPVPVPVPEPEPVRAAVREPRAAYERLSALYAELDAEIARLAPRCDGRALCCDFGKVDHILFASKLEVDYVKDHTDRARYEAPTGNCCPLLQEGRCSAREVRMLGCRAYYCQPGWEPIGFEIYERYYARIKEIARDCDLEWNYAPAIVQLRDGT